MEGSHDMPASSTTSEGTLTLNDGVEIYTKTWFPGPDVSPPKARLVMIHGFSDHCNNYERLLPYLASRGIQVHSCDQRGWGRSVHVPAHRGRTGPTTQVNTDMTTFLTSVLSLTPRLPTFLMGHSMGGAQVLYYAYTASDSVLSQLNGIIASAPLIALHPRVRPWKTTMSAGRLAGRLMPHYHIVNKISPSLMSHDEAENTRWAEDPLNHNTGTLEGLAGMFDRSRVLDSPSLLGGEDRSASGALPEGINAGGATRLLIVHGTEDQINDFDATERFVGNRCAGVRDVTFTPYEGKRHCMHIDTGYEAYREDIANWLLARLDPSVSITPEKTQGSHQSSPPTSRL